MDISPAHHQQGLPFCTPGLGPLCTHHPLGLSGQVVRAPRCSLFLALGNFSCRGAVCRSCSSFLLFSAEAQRPRCSQATLAGPGSWVRPEAAADPCLLSTGQGRPQLASLHVGSVSHGWESEVRREGAYQGPAVGTWQARIPARSAGLKVSVSQHTALGLQPLERHCGEAQWGAATLVQASGVWSPAGYSVHF